MRLAICLALGLVTLVTGQDIEPRKATAKTSPTPAALPADPALQARVDTWWKARQVRDHKVMYDLMDSEYRASCNYEAFVSQNLVRTRFDIPSHQVLSATRTGDRAIVRVSYVAKTHQFGDQNLAAEEPWIRDSKGNWWKYWEPVATPFPTPTPPPGTPRDLPCKTP